jgi:alcohol dehydrogenase class IV
MMLASLMGAVAFQKGLGIVHSLSHPLSTLLDMHHGLANAINLPYGMAFNAPVSEDRFQRMAQHMGLPHGDDIPKALKDLNQSLGIPLKLSQCGVTPEHIENLAALAYEDFCLPLNPREATIDHLRDIYKSAL